MAAPWQSRRKRVIRVIRPMVSPMIFDYIDTDITPVFASVLLGGLLGLVFGAAAQVSRFCLRRGVVMGGDRKTALGVWLTALLVAVLGTQAAVATGYLDFSDHRLHVSALPVVAVLVGGALFGAGMVLTRGCISRLTVLTATGNLRAMLVLIVFAIIAHATLKGVLAPLRLALGSTTVELGDATALSGWPGGTPLWTALLSIALIAVIWRSGARPLHLAMAAVIGVLAPLGWIGTGYLLLDDFDPIPLASMSFTAPWADTLFWGVASSAIPAGFGTGLIGGVLAGAFLSAAARRELSLVSFESPAQTLRYLGGAALMGLGGVLAGGCTVGAGLSGIGSLSVAAVLALVAIIFGAVVTDRVLLRGGTKSAVPAE